MCGIVGHLGPANSVQVVVEGLERLEYRGYDSAGVSYLDQDGALKIVKREGKLDALRAALGPLSAFNAFSCIGHTRWATHGEVSDANSHPHTDGRISVVHNGIIENSEELRASVPGHRFRSGTDSEVFLALVTKEREAGRGLPEAVSASFARLEGNSAFVVLDGGTGDIVSVKRGAPLVCGIHEAGSEALVSSDPYALSHLADKLYFPGDRVVCHLSAKNENLVNFQEFDGQPSSRVLSREPSPAQESTDKGDFEHFMLKEIHEQPGLVRGVPAYYLEGEGLERLEELSSLAPGRVLVAACGTAHYAGMLVAGFLEEFNRIPCVVDLASEFRYRRPVLRADDAALLISQSGETADTLAARALCGDHGLKTICLINVQDSTLHRECDAGLVIRAGIEVGVASTKAFTQQVLVGRLLSLCLSPGWRDAGERAALEGRIRLLAGRIDDLLRRSDEIQAVAAAIHRHVGFFFTGRGRYYPIALEGALKLKEIAYVHAEGYASGELKHGPIALIDDRMVNVAVVGPELRAKTISNIEEIKARGGSIVCLGPRDDPPSRRVADHFLPLDFEGLGELAPLYVNVANQLLAYHIAKNKGTDIDKPRNLAKSVTVE